MTLLTALLLALPLATVQPAPPAPAPSASPVSIELKNGTEAEARTRDQLLRLLKEHDASRWIFTRRIIVDGSGVIPHSHPVLTLSTRHLKDDDLLLATFVHEQLHWYLDADGERAKPVLEELRRLYPDAPAGYPQGGNDQDSTYQHLIVCYWELQAVEDLLGELRAFQIGRFWSNDHYMWIYRKVQEEGYKVGPLIRKHGLIPDAAKPAAAAPTPR